MHGLFDQQHAFFESKNLSVRLPTFIFRTTHIRLEIPITSFTIGDQIPITLPKSDLRSDQDRDLELLKKSDRQSDRDPRSRSLFTLDFQEMWCKVFKFFF